MNKEDFALGIFEGQDERDTKQEECFADLLISQAILDSNDSDDFITTISYWICEMEKAINSAKDIEDENDGMVFLEN